ncbi:hypothetical protein APHAL10511_005219, partial [Amanita phalloides]
EMATSAVGAGYTLDAILLQLKNKPHLATSVFQVPWVPGNLFIEAKSKVTIEEICNNIFTIP